MPASPPSPTTALRRLVLLLATLAAVTASLGPLTAQVIYLGPLGSQTAPTTGAWNNSTHWSGGTLPTSADTTHLSFGGSGATGYTATNDLGAFTLNQLTLASTSTAALTIAGNALDLTGTAPLVSQTGVGPVTIANALNLGNDTTFDVITGATLTLTGTLSGIGTGGVDETSALFKSGEGTLVLAGGAANTVAAILVDAGELKLSKTSGVAFTQYLEIAAGATVTATAAGQFSSAAAVIVDGTLDLGGFNATVFGLYGFDTGTINLGTNPASQFAINGAGFSSYEGQITGSGSVRVSGSATVELWSASSYSGGTSVQTGGKLYVENLTGSATGTGPVTVASNATLGGGGVIAPTSGGVTINGTLEPGGFDSDVLTFGSALTSTTLTLSGTSYTSFLLCDCNILGSVAVFGQLNILAGASMDISIAPLATASLTGNYSLFSFTTGAAGTFTSVSFNGEPVSNPTALGSIAGTHHLIYGANSITLASSAIPEPSTYAALAGLGALALALYRGRKSR